MNSTRQDVSGCSGGAGRGRGVRGGRSRGGIRSLGARADRGVGRAVKRLSMCDVPEPPRKVLCICLPGESCPLVQCAQRYENISSPEPLSHPEALLDSIAETPMLRAAGESLQQISEEDPRDLESILRVMGEGSEHEDPTHYAPGMCVNDADLESILGECNQDHAMPQANSLDIINSEGSPSWEDLNSIIEKEFMVTSNTVIHPQQQVQNRDVPFSPVPHVREPDVTTSPVHTTSASTPSMDNGILAVVEDHVEESGESFNGGYTPVLANISIGEDLQSNAPAEDFQRLFNDGFDQLVNDDNTFLNNIDQQPIIEQSNASAGGSISHTLITLQKQYLQEFKYLTRAMNIARASIASTYDIYIARLEQGIHSNSEIADRLAGHIRQHRRYDQQREKLSSKLINLNK